MPQRVRIRNIWYEVVEQNSETQTIHLQLRCENKPLWKKLHDSWSTDTATLPFRETAMKLPAKVTEEKYS
jgi:hypothetical protein